jgi:phage tail-like protein
MSATTEWPLPKFYFTVEIDNIPNTIGFQGCEGLESEISVMEYRAGNSPNFFKTKRPGLMSYSNITLKKGMFTGDANMYEWYKELALDHQHSNRRTVIISLMDESNTVVFTWTLENAFVTKFTPTGFDAEADTEVAIEELEFCCESWSMTV